MRRKSLYLIRRERGETRNEYDRGIGHCKKEVERRSGAGLVYKVVNRNWDHGEECHPEGQTQCEVRSEKGM